MKKETLEEAAERVAKLKYGPTIYGIERVNAFKDGAKWQQEQDKNKYSKEEVINFLEKREDYLGTEPSIIDYLDNREWFEQFKKGIKD